MSTKKKTTTNEKVTPPSWALPVITDLSARTGAAVNEAADKRYEGDFLAGENAVQMGGLASQLGASQLQAQNAAQSQQLAAGLAEFRPQVDPIGLRQFDAAGQGLTPIGQQRQANLSEGFGAGNLQETIMAYARDPLRQALERQLPALNASAIANGAWGSEAQAVTLPSLIARDTNESIANIAARLGFEDFNQTRAFNQNEQAFTDQFNESQRLSDLGFGLETAGFNNNALLQERQMQQMLASQMLQDMLARTQGGQQALDASSMAAMMPGANMLQVGNTLQGFDQARLDNQRQQFIENVVAPFRALELGTNIINPLSAPYVSRSGTTTSKTTGLGPILQGAVGLGALGLGAFGPGGPFAGASKAGG